MSKNVIVGQSGGPTAVINSSLAGVISKARELGADNIYGMVNGIEGFLNGQYVDLNKQIKDDTDIKLLMQTPSSYLGSCRYKLPGFESGKEVYEKLFAKLSEMEITAFIYIGGNDSMDTIKNLSAYGKMVGSNIKFIGAPKTIDNDLAVTDHTPGYGSAAKYIAAMTKEVIRDSNVYNLKSVTILEIMGRNAGWLTAASALAKGEDSDGPDLIYLPEVPFDFDKFIEKIKNLLDKKGNVIIAVSEGITLADGRNVCELGGTIDKLDAFGHKILTGAGQFLANTLKDKLGCKTRAIEFNTPQRAAAHFASKTDIDEAFMTGGYAVKIAFEGKTGEMVIMKRVGNYNCVAESFDINKIANEIKFVPNEWICDDGTNVTEDFINYARPLIENEPSLIFENGLPKHIVRK